MTGHCRPRVREGAVDEERQGVLYGYFCRRSHRQGHGIVPSKSSPTLHYNKAEGCGPRVVWGLSLLPFLTPAKLTKHVPMFREMG